MGTPYYIYLDSNYKPIDKHIGINDPDPGKTALMVDDNPLAEGVMALAETTPNGTTVSLINTNDKSFIMMFFDKGNNFPSSFIIETQGERFNAFLSSYDTQKERYSIAFEQGGENFTVDNVIMNGSILNIYNDDPALTEAQNTRIRNIYTAMGVFASLTNVFSDYDDTTKIYLFFGWLNKLMSPIAKFFATVAVVALCVAAVLAVPVVIGTAVVTIVGSGIASAIALGVAVVAAAIAVVAELSYYEEERVFVPSTPPVLPPETPTLFVTIQKDGSNINSEAVYYLAPNSAIEFDIIFINRTDDPNDIQYLFYDTYKEHIHTLPTDLTNTTTLIFAINGVAVTYIPQFLTKGNGAKLKVSRNATGGNGFGGGYVDFVLNFILQEVSVNSTKLENTSLRQDGKVELITSRFYHIKFTVDPDNAKI